MGTGISDDHASVCWLWLVLLGSAPCVVERVLEEGEAEHHPPPLMESLPRAGTVLHISHASSCGILPTALEALSLGLRDR